MKIVKSIAIISTMIVFGSSVALAQNTTAPGSQKAVAATGPSLAPSHHKFKHHQKMYMTTSHKHKHMKPATQG